MPRAEVGTPKYLANAMKSKGLQKLRCPKALAKADAARKKERATTSDEQRERNLIAEQIERAREAGGEDQDPSESAAQGIQRDEGDKLVLSFGSKKSESPSVETTEPTPSNSATKPEESEASSSKSRLPLQLLSRPRSSLSMFSSPEMHSRLARIL
ncbi:hypothetical protein RhiLY_05471 [Ceratobasidium sp. AG-Ba]|nr:hypothetical protein RhiLY_05471 [Ceratobasidium sp. AG-Ba]